MRTTDLPDNTEAWAAMTGAMAFLHTEMVGDALDGASSIPAPIPVPAFAPLMFSENADSILAYINRRLNKVEQLDPKQ